VRLTYVTYARGGVGGAEALILALLAGGRSRGCQQTVLNIDGSAGSGAFAAACADVDYREFRGRWPHGALAARRWLRNQIRDAAPDVVHVSLFMPSIVLASIRGRPGPVRLLTHVYGDGVNSLSHPRLRRRLDGWACRRFHHIVAISESVSRFLIDQHGCRPDRVRRIMPGWAGEPQPWIAGGRPPTIVSVARLRPEKGHATLLAAFAIVLEHEPTALLVLVGDGPLRAQLEDFAREHGMAANVEFAGAVPDIWPYLAAADVFALASKIEAFGIAVVEAMAAGLPVVAPAVGGIPELVTPGVTGELFAPGDAEALAACLLAVLSSDRRHEMASAALATAAHHTMDRTIEKYFELYEQLSPTPPGLGVEE